MISDMVISDFFLSIFRETNPMIESDNIWVFSHREMCSQTCSGGIFGQPLIQFVCMYVYVY